MKIYQNLSKILFFIKLHSFFTNENGNTSYVTVVFKVFLLENKYAYLFDFSFLIMP